MEDEQVIEENQYVSIEPITTVTANLSLATEPKPEGSSQGAEESTKYEDVAGKIASALGGVDVINVGVRDEATGSVMEMPLKAVADSAQSVQMTSNYLPAYEVKETGTVEKRTLLEYLQTDREEEEEGEQYDVEDADTVSEHVQISPAHKERVLQEIPSGIKTEEDEMKAELDKALSAAETIRETCETIQLEERTEDDAEAKTRIESSAKVINICQDIVPASPAPTTSAIQEPPQPRKTRWQRFLNRLLLGLAFRTRIHHHRHHDTMLQILKPPGETNQSSVQSLKAMGSRIKMGFTKGQTSENKTTVWMDTLDGNLRPISMSVPNKASKTSISMPETATK